MILNQIRERTQILHEQLEASSELMSPTLTRERYVALLKRFYGFYFPVEPVLLGRAEWADLGLHIEDRRKLPRMRADFLALGLDPDAIHRLPLCPTPSLPSLKSFEEILGCMYVLEGATLGGQIISRHLQTQLGINENSGCAFFGSYGQEVGPLWKSFIAVLSKYPKTQAQNEKIVQSACRTFQSFQDWQKAETA